MLELYDKTTIESILIPARKIRLKEHLIKIPNNKPGWYRWWCPETELKRLLNSKYISKKYLEKIMSHLTKKEIKGRTYYYVYVGVAINESIRDRLNWHVNQHHSKSSVESGFLSTLRQSLSSLVAGNQYDEIATNNFIDKLIIEYTSINLSIHSKEAKYEIETIEKNEINSNVLPLNIRDNKNKLIINYLKELSICRKQSKINNKSENECNM